MAAQSKITKSARLQECQIRIPGVCNRNVDTVVFCHLQGGGIGKKRSDLFGAYGCSSCHDVVDGRVNNVMLYGDVVSKEQIMCWFYDGIVRTQELLLEKGLVEIK